LSKEVLHYLSHRGIESDHGQGAGIVLYGEAGAGSRQLDRGGVDMAATYAQTAQYAFHKRCCATMHIPQATLQKRSLMGTLGTASSTGNQIYSGPGPVITDQITSKVPVWCITAPMVIRSMASSGNQNQFGRQAIPMLKAQIPVIDDFSRQVIVNEDDLLIDASGTKYRVQNPVVTPDGSLWSFQLVELR
jgi:hypothetical protein